MGKFGGAVGDRMIIRVGLKAVVTGISEYQQPFVGANVWKRSQRRTVH